MPVLSRKLIVFIALLFPVSILAQDCKYGMPYQGPDQVTPLSNTLIRAGRLNYSNIVPDKLASALTQTFFKTLELTSATKASVSLYSNEYGYWSNQQVGNQELYWLASIGKLVTAIIITQLMEEKQLLSSDTIDRWFPDIPHAELITIKQLLTHTSGLHNFNQIDSVNQRQGYKTPTELIEASTEHGSDFCPGTSWNYSNTGYLVLARIAELLDEQDYAEIVQSRIAKPLNLRSFRVAKKNDPQDAFVHPESVHGHDKSFVSEVASIHGAGSIVSTMDDALYLLSAYLRAELISDSSLEESLRTLYPLFTEVMGYGRGIVVTRVPDPKTPTVWVGHAGGSPKGKALLLFDLKRETYIALALNTQAPAEAIANQLLKELDQYED